MRKFIIHTRPIPGSCRSSGPSIVEIECEIITATEDPSVMWLRNGEYKVRVLKPDFLHEPKEQTKEDGTKEKIMVPPTYYGHFLYETIEGARDGADQMIRKSLKLADLKAQARGATVSHTEEEIQAKVSEVQEVRL